MSTLSSLLPLFCSVGWVSIHSIQKTLQIRFKIKYFHYIENAEYASDCRKQSSKYRVKYSWGSNTVVNLFTCPVSTDMAAFNKISTFDVYAIAMVRVTQFTPSPYRFLPTRGYPWFTI
jgi:hypothetical protein